MESKKLYIYKNNKFIVPDSGDNLPDVSTASVDDVLSLNSSKEPVWSTPKDSLEVVEINDISNIDASYIGKIIIDTDDGNRVYYPLESGVDYGKWIYGSFDDNNPMLLSYRTGQTLLKEPLANDVVLINTSVVLGDVTLQFPLRFDESVSEDGFIDISNFTHTIRGFGRYASLSSGFILNLTDATLVQGKIYEFDTQNNTLAQTLFGLFKFFAKAGTINLWVGASSQQLGNGTPLICTDNTTTFTLTALTGQEFEISISDSKVVITATSV